MIKFGTDGWRAIIAEDFTHDNVRHVIQAFCDYLVPPPLSGSLPKGERGSHMIYVGFDRRYQSDRFAETVASVLCANGFTVVLASQFCPSPCIAWMTKTKKAMAGVMVTASHNPSIWNGIKFKESYGGAASPEYTSAVEAILEKNLKVGKIPQLMRLEEATKKGLLKTFDPMDDYVRTLQKHLSLGKIRKARWKIAFDPLFGAGAGFLEKILNQDLTTLHGEFNPSFGGLNPEPIENNLKDFLKFIRDQKLDVGLSTDGDADRIGAVDENGNFVDSHHIFALILKHLVTVKKLEGSVLKTVSTSSMIEKLCQKYGLPLHETPIGFKHLCKKMRELPNPLIAGEESGGIALANHVFERDGLLSGLMLVEIMTHHGKRLGELVKGLHREIGPHYFERNDLHLTEAQIQKVREKLPTLSRDKLAGVKVKSIQTLDGCKFHLEDGSWLLIRASGTEPLLRLYAEASTNKKVMSLLKAAHDFL